MFSSSSARAGSSASVRTQRSSSHSHPHSRRPTTPPPLPPTPDLAQFADPSRSLPRKTSGASASRKQRHAVSPPSTPLRASRRRSASHHNPVKQSLHAWGDSPEDIRRSKHSHELSWTSNNRASLVDNLLSSLDSLSHNNADPDTEYVRPAELDWDPFALKSRHSIVPTPYVPPRARSMTHYSSSSSNMESVRTSMAESTTTERAAATESTHKNELCSGTESLARTSTDTAKPDPPVTSEASQDDLETTAAGESVIAEADRNRPSWKRRSVSLDQLWAESIRTSSVLSRGRPVPSMYSRYDSDYSAAPEPSVANGPRTLHNPNATGPVYIDKAPPRSALRKITTQSDLRASTQALPTPPVPADVRNQASNFVRANGIRGQSAVPPQPNSSLQQASSQTSLTGMGRPGFFRRVFGGASVRDAPKRVDSVDTGATALPQITSSPSGPSKSSSDAQPTVREQQSPQPTPSLGKKSSSFFRRRKKSTSEPAPPLPPPLPLNNNLNVTVPKPEHSPSMSSLRKIMDQYLDGGVEVKPNNLVPRPTTQDSSADTESLDMFHSGYDKPADGSLARVHRLSQSPTRKAVKDSQQTDSPKMKIKVKKQPLAANSDADSISMRSSSLAVRTASLKENERTNSQISTSSQASGAPRPSTSSATGKLARPKSPEYSLVEKMFLPAQVANEGLRNGSVQLSTLSENGSRSTSIISTALDTATTAAFASAMHSPLTPSSQYHSATSLPLPSAQLSAPDSRKSEADSLRRSRELTAEGAEYRERARRIFDGDEEDVTKAEAAAWLGETNSLSARTRREYMALFDFSGANVLSALRMLCGRLLLRGETQQFDRIITALSERWCECNPSHGFEAQDVVHTILYSLILLNTDLHLADIGEKMSRSAYVKNTLPTIRRVVADAAPGAFKGTVKGSTLPLRPPLPWSDSTNSLSPSVTATSDAALPSPTERGSLELPRPMDSHRLSFRPNISRHDSENADGTTWDASNALVNQPCNGSMKMWEIEVESILKAFYTSIKNDPLPLLRPPVPEGAHSNYSQPANGGNGTLKRSGSIISKAASDATSHRFKPGLRAMTMGFPGKYNRSRQKMYPPSTRGSSSRTSFDDGSSLWSPPHSSALSSKYSYSKTLTSTSMQSLGQYHGPTIGNFKHSIGFANALSQAIIREEDARNRDSGVEGDTASISVPVGLLEDEALALEGAPWAKEGLVKHKHYLEGEGKKAKERSWSECFAVISSGKLTLFAFNTSSSRNQSSGRRVLSRPSTAGPRASSVAAPRVGGGDWMENAEQLDVFILRQTIASTLPPPGYSKTRPHVWALSLPSGAVHLFHVGTPEIASEFMSTANYWSARLSKEPLAGGVSNIEYGWSENVINPAVLERASSDSRVRPIAGASGVPASPTRGAISPASIYSVPPSSIQTRIHGHMHTNSTGSRPSIQSSVRTSLDAAAYGFSSRVNNTVRLPGDKVSLAEWHPPTQSLMPSQLMEVDQLRALSAYVSLQESELEKHNELKTGIELAYTPRHANYSRALANWQRRSDYLLREIVKFSTYVESLNAAQTAKDAFYAKKEKNGGLPTKLGSGESVADKASLAGPATDGVAAVAVESTNA